MKSIFYLIFLLISLMRTAIAATVLIRTEANPKEIYIGDQIRYQITVTYSSDISARPLNFEKNHGEFEVLNITSSGPANEKDGKQTISHTLVLTIFSTGTFKIPSSNLQFSDSSGSISEAKTEEIIVKVKSLLEEKGDEGHLRPLKGLFNFRSYLWLWIVLGIMGVVFLFFLVGKYLRQKKGNNALPQSPPRPAEEIAIEALTALQNEDFISQGNYKEFYFRLSIICRQYLENRYSISAIEKTTSELNSEFRKMNLSLESVNLLRDLFENSDLAKFAKFTPSNDEIVLDLERAQKFISLTSPKKITSEEPAKENIPV